MKIYKSKIGYGFLFIVFIVFVMIIGFVAFKGVAKKELFIMTGLLIVILFFLLYLFNKTEYRITDKVLKIRCGFVYKKDLDIGKIKSISETNNPVSAPAASLDRIELRFGDFNSVIISPKDKINFANELTKINPKIDNQIINKT